MREDRLEELLRGADARNADEEALKRVVQALHTSVPPAHAALRARVVRISTAEPPTQRRTLRARRRPVFHLAWLVVLFGIGLGTIITASTNEPRSEHAFTTESRAHRDASGAGDERVLPRGVEYDAELPKRAVVLSPAAERVISRLTAAGFEVEEIEVRDATRPVPVGVFNVAIGAAQVTGYVYASASAAVNAKNRFRRIARPFPQRTEVIRAGRVVYVGAIEKPARFPIGKFNRVVSVGGDAS